MKLHLAVANFERLAMPLAHLLGDPDGVLLGAEDIEQIDGRIDAVAIGLVINGEQAHGQRLWLDAEGLSAERAGQLEIFLLAAAGGERALAVDLFGGHVRIAGGLPLDADGFDAKIVLRANLEGERLAVEDDFLPRETFASECGRLILAGIDRDGERRCTGETIFILPLEDELARVVDSLRLAG